MSTNMALFSNAGLPSVTSLTGALRALQIYRDEIDRVLGLIGCTSLDQLTREHVDMRYAQGHSATTGG